MFTEINEAVGRIWIFSREHCNAVDNAGYGNLQIDKLHIAIEQLLKKLKPHGLQKRKVDIINWRRN